MNILVVGGGKVGSYLASLLLQSGHQVKIIEIRQEHIETLHHDFPPEIIIQGSGTNPAVLEASGIRKANGVVAVTGADETNLVIATLARFEFNVPRVIARVNNPKNAWLFTPEMGVDVGLNQAELMARLVAEEMSLGDMMTLLQLRKGQYSLVEEKIHPQAPAANQAIRDLNLPKDCVLVAILRQSEVILPRGDTVLKSDDEILAIIHANHSEELAKLLGGKS